MALPVTFVERRITAGWAPLPFVARDLLALAGVTAEDDRTEALNLLRSAHELATRHHLLAVAWKADDRIQSLSARERPPAPL